MPDINPEFVFDHYHRKITKGDGVACPISDDGKAALRDGRVASVDKATASAEVTFIGGTAVTAKGKNLVKHLSKE